MAELTAQSLRPKYIALTLGLRMLKSLGIKHPFVTTLMLSCAHMGGSEARGPDKVLIGLRGDYAWLASLLSVELHCLHSLCAHITTLALSLRVVRGALCTKHPFFTTLVTP